MIKTLRQNWVKSLFLMGFFLSLLGCQSAYYNTMEKMGYAKRDILVDRVEDATETQAEVKEQFQSAYQAFNALLKLETSDLETRYETLNESYQDSLAKAEELEDRVEAIESVADALFDEWEQELSEYKSASLKTSSAKKLKITKTRYNNYLKSLKRAEAKVQPVLEVLNDQVLFLKHNLNAEKVSALKGEIRRFDSDVQVLIKEMDRSIRDAKQFIKGL
ncbi:DUF2959 domain-containing protein [Motiliproteus sp. MSK22-1]|uniref:DUF2959 domain-containing protein n=1 Tax=Motiliproteus sp. MSK22-1 TaxID=1897630 RepID=UPI0009788A2B|nr:DUF2959 domain-containing protein [Motiliproteus sp. MSK22-1]OMH25910.1 DNA repair protein [Motiliproteus sp. MSK22-1]